MADQTKVSSVTRERVTGDSTGRNTFADVLPGAARDVLTGERYGLTFIADNARTHRETLTGDRYGQSVFADVLPGVARDVITGDGYGQTWIAAGVTVYREVIMMEPPYKAANVIREVLCSMENEPLTVARQIAGYRQSVVMLRPTMQQPSTVKSLQTVPTLREQAVQRATRDWPRSTDFVSTVVMQSMHSRIVVPPSQTWTMIEPRTLTQQVVRSRGIAYVPVSEVRVGQERQAVVQRRDFTAAPQVRTPITVGKFVQQWIASRARQVVVITTEAHVGQHIEQVVQQDTRPAPRSASDVTGLVHMVIQKHTVVPPGIDDRAATLVQQIAMPRVPAPPFGLVMAQTVVSMSMLGVDVEMHRSLTSVKGSVALAVMRRDTYAPAYALGRHTASLVQQSVVDRSKVKPQGYRIVGSMNLAFVLGRDVPAPWDVIDPSIGRHAFSLSHMTVMHRETTPPGVIATHSRYVNSLVGQVVIGDQFPAPDYPPPVIPETYVNQVGQVFAHADRDDWSPVSAVTTGSMVESVVVGDNEGWIDATIPTSDVTVRTVYERLVVGDSEFPNSMVSQSAAEVMALVGTVAVGDSGFPNSMEPQSEIAAHGVIEFAALGDVGMSDPSIPLSDVIVRRLAAITVLPDASLTGRFEGSEMRSQNVAEFLVLRDRSLVGIPLRGGPRPVVSVSMT